MKLRFSCPCGVSRHAFANHIRRTAKLRAQRRAEANRLARWHGPARLNGIGPSLEDSET